MHEWGSSLKNQLLLGVVSPPHQVSLLLVSPLSSLRVQLQGGELGGSFLQRLKNTQSTTEDNSHFRKCVLNHALL